MLAKQPGTRLQIYSVMTFTVKFTSVGHEQMHDYLSLISVLRPSRVTDFCHCLLLVQATGSTHDMITALLSAVCLWQAGGGNPVCN